MDPLPLSLILGDVQTIAGKGWAKSQGYILDYLQTASIKACSIGHCQAVSPGAASDSLC